MQERVRTFLRENDMLCGAAARCLDLASETGEVAKEILRGMDYGKRPYTPTPETAEELGDCLFCCWRSAASWTSTPKGRFPAHLKNTARACGGRAMRARGDGALRAAYAAEVPCDAFKAYSGMQTSYLLFPPRRARIVADG